MEKNEKLRKEKREKEKLKKEKDEKESKREKKRVNIECFCPDLLMYQHNLRTGTTQSLMPLPKREGTNQTR